MLKRGAMIVAASHNEGKVRELAELLVPFGVECISSASLGLPEPEEKLTVKSGDLGDTMRLVVLGVS